MSIRLRDVADRAGVSVKTVSNVVNGFAHVSPATRRKVETCAAALIPHATIAPLIGLGSVNTLKKHYPEELARGGAKACLTIAEKLQKLVEAGNEEVILYLAKVKLGLN